MKISEICFLSKNVMDSVSISYSLKVKQSIKVFSSWLMLQQPHRLWQLFQIFHSILSPIQGKWPLLLQVCAISSGNFTVAGMASLSWNIWSTTFALLLNNQNVISNNFHILIGRFWIMNVKCVTSADLWLWGLYRLCELLFLLIIKYIYL